MKYFITGVTGFIGSNLAQKLCSKGHLVNAIIRNPAKQAFLNLPGLTLYDGTLFDKKKLQAAMNGCDVVFHLAALAKPWAKDPLDFYRINVEGTVSIFDAAIESHIKKVVFTSSAATMSPSSEKEQVNESTPRLIPYFNAYESSKAEAELKAIEYCNKGLEVVTVNPSRVYGPGPLNPSNSVTKMIAGYLKGTWRFIPGDGKKIGNYVFIDDVVKGHLLASTKGKAGDRYILGGENLTFNEFFRQLESHSGTIRNMIHLPLPLMTFAAKLMEWQNPLTGIPPKITSNFVKKYLNHWNLSSNKAIEELGYHITTFKDGAEKTINWLKLVQGKDIRYNV